MGILEACAAISLATLAFRWLLLLFVEEVLFPCPRTFMPLPPHFLRKKLPLNGGGLLYEMCVASSSSFSHKPRAIRILWCHGKDQTADARTWASLTDLGFTHVWLIEYPGYGETNVFYSSLRNRSATSLKLQTIESVVDALTNHGPWDFVIGFSLGGMLCAEAFETCRDRDLLHPINYPLKALILLNSALKLSWVIGEHAGSLLEQLFPLEIGLQTSASLLQDDNSSLPPNTVLVHALQDQVIPFVVAQKSSDRLNLKLIPLPLGDHCSSPWLSRQQWLPLVFGTRIKKPRPS